MKRWVARVALAIVAVALVAVVAAFVLVRRQGVPEGDWANLSGMKVRFDPRGIPTIEAADWDKVVEAEGFVVASERMFQMDLMRRNAAGRLAAWFGPGALALDRKNVLEDWDGVATRAYAAATSQ